HMPAASVAITVLTLVLLIVSTAIVLTGLDVWNTSAVLGGPAWLRRLWLAVLIAAAAATWLEPIVSNFAFRQLNLVLLTLVNTDQNIAGALARQMLDEHERFPLWVAACLLVLAATIWAMRRVLRAGEPILAVICVALFGLVVSPVSWSHHWVWALPTVLVTGV